MRSWASPAGEAFGPKVFTLIALSICDLRHRGEVVKGKNEKRLTRARARKRSSTSLRATKNGGRPHGSAMRCGRPGCYGQDRYSNCATRCSTDCFRCRRKSILRRLRHCRVRISVAQLLLSGKSLDHPRFCVMT